MLSSLIEPGILLHHRRLLENCILFFLLLRCPTSLEPINCATRKRETSVFQLVQTKTASNLLERDSITNKQRIRADLSNAIAHSTSTCTSGLCGVCCRGAVRFLHSKNLCSFRENPFWQQTVPPSRMRLQRQRGKYKQQANSS